MVSKRFLSLKITPSSFEDTGVKLGLIIASGGIAQTGLASTFAENTVLQKYVDQALQNKQIEAELINSKNNSCVSPLANKFLRETCKVFEASQEGQYVRLCDAQAYQKTVDDLAGQKTIMKIFLSSQLNQPVTVGGKVTSNLLENTGKALEVQNKIDELEVAVDNFHKVGTNLWLTQQDHTVNFVQRWRK